MQIDITQIIVALIGLLGTILTVFLVPLMKTKLSAAQWEELQKWVKVGVAAAEQLSETGVIRKDARKQWVMDFLNSKGFTADLDKIDQMIEAAVYELPNKLTNTEVKKIVSQQVLMLTDGKVDEKVTAVVEEAVASAVPTVVAEAVNDKLDNMVSQKVQEALPVGESDVADEPEMADEAPAPRYDESSPEQVTEGEPETDSVPKAEAIPDADPAEEIPDGSDPTLAEGVEEPKPEE